MATNFRVNVIFYGYGYHAWSEAQALPSRISAGVAQRRVVDGEFLVEERRGG